MRVLVLLVSWRVDAFAHAHLAGKCGAAFRALRCESLPGSGLPCHTLMTRYTPADWFVFPGFVWEGASLLAFSTGWRAGQCEYAAPSPRRESHREMPKREFHCGA